MYTVDSAVETSRFMISVKEKKQIRDKNRTRPAHSCFLLRNKRSGGTQNGVLSVSLSLAVFHDLFAKIERKGIKFRLRNRVRITHDNQLVAPAVGGLIRRMGVRKGAGCIAAARVKALTADGCVIDKRIDFQNDRLVLPRPARRESACPDRDREATVRRRNARHRCMCRNPNRENQARKRAIQQAHIKVIKGIAHHVALIRRETQLVSGKTRNDTGPKRPPSTGR